MKDKFIKITSAVYRLLDFFPEGEPLKNRAKDKALEITENLVLVFDTQGWASMQKDRAMDQLSKDIEILLNYLKLAKSFGWIDSINFLIIEKEYENIRKLIQPNRAQNRIDTTEMPVDNIALNKIRYPENIVAQSQEVTFKKTAEDQVSFVNEKPVQQASSHLLPEKQPKSPEFLISERQKKILQVLTDKGKAQVADFKAVLGDVTKRTIRRDLDELLKNKKVIRTGEWNQVFYEIKSIAQ